MPTGVTQTLRSDCCHTGVFGSEHGFPLRVHLTSGAAMPPHPVDVAVALFASQQAGNFSLRQVIAAGGNRELARRRVRARRWLDHDHAVYGLPGFPESGWSHLWRAWLDAGPAAMAASTTVLALRRVEGFRIAPVHLLVPHGAHHRNRWATVHQTRRVPQPVLIGGIPTTPLVRAVLDVAAETPPVRLGRVIDEVVVGREANLEAFREGLAWMQRTRRNGAVHLERALLGRTHGYQPPRSELERMLDAVLATLPGAPPEHEVDLPGRAGAAHRVDRLFRDPPLIIEGDSRLYHARLASMDEDRRRDRHALRLGFPTLRYGWFELTEEALEVRAEVLDVLGRGASASRLGGRGVLLSRVP